MNLAIRTAALAAFLTLSPVLAQDVPDFLAEQEGFDEEAAGPLNLGMYLNGMKNLGTFQLRFEEAPEGSGATYKAIFDGKFAFGADSNAGKTEALLDEKFRLVSNQETSHEVKGGKEVHKEEATARVGEAWVKTTVEDGTESKKEIPYEPVHVQLVSYVLLVRALELTEGTTWKLRCLEWDEGKTGPIDVSVSVGGVAPFQHRGAEIPAREVRFAEPEKAFVFRVTEEGEILAIEFAGAPIALVAGTEEEVGQDMAGTTPKTTEPGAEDPLAAVVVYLRVLTGEKPPEALDAVCDWEVIRGEAAAKDPKVAPMDADTFAMAVKAEFQKLAKSGKVKKEEVDAIAKALKVETEGDDATVAIPGREKDPFRVKKTERGWMIQHFGR